MHREKEQALLLLHRLHILTATAASRDEPQALSLTTNFVTSLRLALTGGGNHQSFGVPATSVESGTVDLEYLDEYARTQWEAILHYIVNSVDERSQSGEGPSQDAKDLLLAGGLVERHRGSVSITQAGFTFLLQEVNAQVWTLLILYIENADKVGFNASMSFYL
jgi:transcription initiation factor TFIIH subunit 4